MIRSPVPYRRLRFAVLLALLGVALAACSPAVLGPSAPPQPTAVAGSYEPPRTPTPPVPPTEPPRPPGAPPASQAAVVVSVRDGQTLFVEQRSKVATIRLLGIAAPAIADSASRGECFGEDAAARLAELLPAGTIVFLEADLPDQDARQRLLRYVWFVDGRGRMVLANEVLVREGLARIDQQPPEPSRHKRLAAAEDDAREAGAGLWTACASDAETEGIAADGAAAAKSSRSAYPPPNESEAAETAVALSWLEATGDINALYDAIHPDSRAVVPRAAVTGWYQEAFLPRGPGVARVTAVRLVTWTWGVTGVTYPDTAEVSFEQPFADGTLLVDVVRLVEHEGRWRWFFGRSAEFVAEQIARYTHASAASPVTDPVGADIDQFWIGLFAASGTAYDSPTLTFFDGTVATA